MTAAGYPAAIAMLNESKYLLIEGTLHYSDWLHSSEFHAGIEKSGKWHVVRYEYDSVLEGIMILESFAEEAKRYELEKQAMAPNSTEGD